MFIQRTLTSLYQPAERVTLDTGAVMTGHRAGHLVQHARPRMTGSVAGHDGVRQCCGRVVL
jgi:hypothetical protein